MKSCLNPFTIKQGLNLETLVKVASEAKFEGLEFSMEEALKFAQEGSDSEVQELFMMHHVAPAQWMVRASLTQTGPGVEQAYRGLLPQFKLAQTIGAPLAMVVVPSRTAEADLAAATRTVVENLRLLAGIAADYGVRLALEFIGLRYPAEGRRDFIVTLGQTLDLISTTNAPNVGVMFDFYHYYTGGSKREDLQAMPGDLLYFVHADDAPPGDVNALTDPMRVLPGEGVIGVLDLLRDMKAIGYDGFVSLELFGDDFRDMDPYQAARRGFRAVNQILQQV